jgi:hypothetical protein
MKFKEAAPGESDWQKQTNFQKFFSEPALAPAVAPKAPVPQARVWLQK